MRTINDHPVFGAAINKHVYVYVLIFIIDTQFISFTEDVYNGIYIIYKHAYVYIYIYIYVRIYLFNYLFIYIYIPEVPCMVYLPS